MSTEHATDDDVTAELGRLVREFFQAVSFEPGQRPPYQALHDLFVPGGKLIRNSGVAPEIAGVAQFIEPRQAMVDAGELTSFLETEVSEITEVFGNVAHRWSTYAKSGTTNGAPLSGRGLISTQFIRTPDGWKISSMAWDDERPGLSVPDRYR